jgi:acyl-CoA reductase-like NAD-dependent aldehyde dehydrogenase
MISGPAAETERKRDRAVPPRLASIVAGERLEGDHVTNDLNPARPREVVAEVILASARDAVLAVVSAASTYAEWQDTPPPARGEVLRRAGDLLDKRAAEIGRDLAREEGKTVAEGIGETTRAAAILRYFGAQTLEPDGETYPSHSHDTFLFARREPLGVITAITPWNFPIAIPAWKIAPALAYGNTVVWKPAEIVPLTSTHLAVALYDAGLPPGVLNLLLATGSEVGDTLLAHDDVAAVTFTGSNRVGQTIQERATRGGKKVQLELGGKNPVVVLADADLGLAAEQVARGAFLSAGQKCTATSRVIVEQPVLAEFSERLAELASTWPVGDPLDPMTKIGPLSSQTQLDTVNGYLELAVQEQARVIVGGRRPREPDEGYYVAPTVITDLKDSSRIAREEIFGPVVALLPADSPEHAFCLANDTPFGLAAGLFTSNLERALRFAREIHAGVVKINQETAGLEYHVPFGGMGQSSSGSREQGKVAREFFTQWKTVYVATPPPS